MKNNNSTAYDAFLLVSFGGPEGMDDVMPFLENVLRGKNVPRERLLAVSKHYELFGGVSPINENNRQLIVALKPVIEASGPKLPIYWGNRNWQPMLTDTIQQMADDGVKRAVALVTSAYSSYSSCRQYLENIENACALVGENAPRIDKIPPFYNHPGFIAANVQQLLTALHEMSADKRQDCHIIFTAHSIPMSMAKGCLYAAQLDETCRAIMMAADLSNTWQLAYQSRSGSPSQPWLEPDINDVISEIGSKGIKNVCIAPIGFVSEHMEIMFDLDTQVKSLCEKLDIGYYRAKTAQSHPEFIMMIKQLVEEKLEQSQDSEGNLEKEFCFAGCCPIS